MANYSINDLEKITGIKRHTIRIWEKRHSILKPKRSKTNIRSYNDQDLKTLLNASILNKNGIKISHIAAMSPAERQNKVIEIDGQSKETSLIIDKLILALMQFDETAILRIFNDVVISRGFKSAMNDIIIPVFKKIGVLWQTGTVNPAQEHLFSNLVRQKLCTGIDEKFHQIKKDAKKFLLFLPEGEWHDIGLLYINFLIRENGYQTLYLGQHTPIDSVMVSIASWTPDYIVISSVNGITRQSLDEMLNKLIEPGQDQQFLVHGLQSSKINLKKFPKLQVINDFLTFDDFLHNLN